MDAVPNPSLEAGQRALKQGNHAEAIAHFEGVCEMELDNSIVSRAAIELVKVYQNLGEVERAIPHCQSLTQHADPKIRQWATATLAKLEAKLPSRTPSQSGLPVPYTPPSQATPSLYTPRPKWRYSERARKWSPLKSPKLTRLWVVGIGTAVVLVWLLQVIVRLALATLNSILVALPLLQPIQLFYRDPMPTLVVLVILLLVLSPWCIDFLLQRFHHLEPLSLRELTIRSPESAKLLQQFCRQRKLPLPKLGHLPTDAPIVLTYGNLPRTARIVVSEGVLTQLADDEIATLYAGQLAHIVHWDFALMSLGVSIVQIPYTIYWQLSVWGDRLFTPSTSGPPYQQVLTTLGRGFIGTVASLSYGIYWLLRLPLLWFSRLRVSYSDRLAMTITGNPNAQTRALLKLGLGISEDIQDHRATSYLLEGFDFLFPVGYQQALTLGSSSPRTPFAAILHWECTNRYRDWLSLSASHPLIGERLHLLARYASFLKLSTEVDLPPRIPPVPHKTAWFSKLKNSYKALPLVQSAVLLGLVMGIILRGILWIVGKVSDWLDIWQLIWLYNSTFFLDGCILIAFSLSIIVLINGYFPDIKPSTVETEPNLGDLFANPDTLSPDSQPIEITGRLLGRRGLLNWLGQDLILQTSTGLVKLHFLSFLGPLGNLLPQAIRPNQLVGQQVTLTGWFRRGVTPWIDIDTLRTSEGKLSRANYPIWLTTLAIMAAIVGAYLIWQVEP